MERFERLFWIKNDHSPFLFVPGFHVILCSGALTRDNNDGRAFVQLRFKNVGVKQIVSAIVSLETFETDGTLLSSEEQFGYFNLNAGCGTEFG